MSKKILLVQSWLGREEHAVAFPIGLATIAAWLPDEYRVKGFDPNVVDDPLTRLRGLVAGYKADVIGVSLRNIDTTNLFDPFVYYNGFLETVRLIREVAPDTPVIVGGAGFSLFAERIMNDLPEADYGVYLEGEETFRDLLAALDDPATVENVKGVYFRRDGQVRFTGERGPAPFHDDTPFPRWDVFDLEPYKRFPFAVGVETKRGCAFKCIYCSYYLLNGSKYRKKSPQRVVDEIAAIRKLGLTGIGFADSVFNFPTDHAVNILRLMMEQVPDIRWLGYLSVTGFTEEFLQTSLQAGMHVFTFSPDAYGDKELDAMGKCMKTDEIARAVEIIRRNPPAEVGFNFFVNGPTYGWGTLLRMFAFIFRTKLKLGRRVKLLRMNLNYIRIEPGTPAHHMALQEGVLSEQTDLLPTDAEGFRKTFYFTPVLKPFNAFFSGFSTLMRKALHRKHQIKV